MTNKYLNYVGKGMAGLAVAGTILFGGLERASADETQGTTQTDPTIYTPPIIVQRPSPNYTPGREGIEGIIIHSTEGSGNGSLNWLIDERSKASSNYLVREDGTIFQLVNDSDTAWHAGRKANKKYLGIEIAGFADKEEFEFTDEEYVNAASLTAMLIHEYKLTPEDVVSHDWVSKNIGGTNHHDPGRNFDWGRFNNLVLNNLARMNADMHFNRN